jgi:hypothetical protein
LQSIIEEVATIATIEEEEDDDGRWAGRGKVSGIEAAGGSCKLLLLLKVVVLLLCT